VDGIGYSARHDPHQPCYALFDRALDLDADWFWELADVYEVGWPP
jgi:hypothetical protein